MWEKAKKLPSGTSTQDPVTGIHTQRGRLGSPLLKGAWGAALLTKIPQNTVPQFITVPGSPLPRQDERHPRCSAPIVCQARRELLLHIISFKATAM